MDKKTKNITNIGITAGVIAIIYHLMQTGNKKTFSNPLENEFEDLDEMRFQRVLSSLEGFLQEDPSDNLDVILQIQSSFMKTTVETIEREEENIRNAEVVANKYRDLFMKSKDDMQSQKTYDKYLQYNHDIKSRKLRILRLKKHLSAMIEKQKEIAKRIAKRH